MKKLLPVLLILIAGCAAPQATVSVPGIERSESAPVRDLRPESEKQAETFSILVTSDAYAIYRVAENTVNPPARRLLQHRAFEKFGAATTPPEITVHHLVIYRNHQAEFRRSAIGAGIGGVIGGLVAGAYTTDPTGVTNSLVDGKVFESLRPTEYRRALYTEQENPGRGSVHIIYMETELQGKRVFTRAVAPVRGKEGENPLIAALESSIKFHLSQYP
jgi:hypothetical protein